MNLKWPVFKCRLLAGFDCRVTITEVSAYIPVFLIHLLYDMGLASGSLLPPCFGTQCCPACIFEFNLPKEEARRRLDGLVRQGYISRV